MTIGLKSFRYQHSCGSTYLNFIVTTNQKQTVDSQRPKRKELKHTTEEYHQTTKGKTKRRNKQRRTTKTTGKQGLKWQ